MNRIVCHNYITNLHELLQPSTHLLEDIVENYAAFCAELDVPLASPLLRSAVINICKDILCFEGRQLFKFFLVFVRQLRIRKAPRTTTYTHIECCVP